MSIWQAKRECREPAVAGTFYPEEREELKSMITKFIDNADVDVDSGDLKAVIVPHAGYIYSGPIAAYAYKLIGVYKKKSAIILGPSHYTTFRGMAESGFKKWRTPLGEVETFSIIGDEDDNVKTIPNAHIPEHSIEVQIPFLQVITDGAKINPILTGDIAGKDGAMVLSKHCDKHLLIVSSDLSHYLPYSDAVDKDRKTIDAILSVDINRFMEIGNACGKKGIEVLLNIAKQNEWMPVLLKYANSGDTAGPKTEVVGYTAIAFYG